MASLKSSAYSHNRPLLPLCNLLGLVLILFVQVEAGDDPSNSLTAATTQEVDRLRHRRLSRSSSLGSLPDEATKPRRKMCNCSFDCLTPEGIRYHGVVLTGRSDLLICVLLVLLKNKLSVLTP